MIGLFEAIDIDQDDARDVLEILLPALWRRSGVDFLTFRNMVMATVPPDIQAEYRGCKGVIPDWAQVGPLPLIPEEASPWLS